MKKHICLNAIMGMGFGFPAILLCMAVSGGHGEVLRELVVWMAASALYGVLSGAVFHWQGNLPLWGSVGLHAGGCGAITMTAAFLCGYVRSVADALPILLGALIVYVIAYAICVLMMKRSEKQVNKALNSKPEQ